MTTLFALPVSEGLGHLARSIRERLALRWHEAKDTAAIELSLLGFGLIIGTVALVWSNSAKPGWALMPTFLHHRAYGVVVLTIGVARAVSIWTGHRGLRYGCAWAGFLVAGSVGTMVWLANPGSLFAAALYGISGMNLYVAGRLDKTGARGKPD